MANNSAPLTEIVRNTAHQAGEFLKGAGEGVLLLYAIPTVWRRFVANGEQDREQGKESMARGYLVGMAVGAGVLATGLVELIWGIPSSAFADSKVVAQALSLSRALPAIAAAGNLASTIYESTTRTDNEIGNRSRQGYKR